MIKKLFLTGLFLTGIACLSASAQTTENDSIALLFEKVNRQQQQIDSLMQYISAQQKEIKEFKIQDKWTARAKYFNISYVNQSYTTENDLYTFKNTMGIALTNGRTYYLHKKPILGMIKFGLDWSFFDINFAMYEPEESAYGGNYYIPEGDENHFQEDYEEESSKMYQAEIGMQFGPSVTINPVSELMINGYFRVTPSYSMMYLDDFEGKYGTFFSVGGAVSYKLISLGVEGRWGKSSWETGSTRFYVGFRF